MDRRIATTIKGVEVVKHTVESLWWYALDSRKAVEPWLVELICHHPGH